jgi:ATP-dependent DNA helicase PIF1
VHEDRGQMLREAKLIIWDEAPMTDRLNMEATHRLLQDVMQKTDPDASRKPFGGKVVLFGGDFRQVLPIIPGEQSPPPKR